MAIVLSMFRRGTDGSLVSEEVPFPRTKDPEDIRVQPLQNGTTILIGPTKWVGIGTDVIQWTLDRRVVEGEDQTEPGELPKGIVLMKFDKDELDILLWIAEQTTFDDRKKQNTVDRLVRAFKRKRGE